MISVSDVRKSFGATTVLNGVDLEICQGEVMSLLGASDSGKSALVRCNKGLEKIDAGKIMADVSKPRELSKARKRSTQK